MSVPMEENTAPSPDSITPRQVSFEFPPDTPRYWMRSDPLETAIMNALSMTFPAGERFFMDSVRAFRDRVEDPELKRDVRAFLAQEALHSREHEALNAFVASQGIKTEIYTETLERSLARVRQFTPRINQLGVTCALEHFTAFLAAGFLTNPEWHAQVHPNVRPLWIWHAIEELEHKSVAFDVFKAAQGSGFVRILTMVLTTVIFIGRVSAYVLHMMAKDGQLFNLRCWATGLWRLIGPRGSFTRLIPDYLAYYKPGFHPSQKDDRALIRHWTRVLAEMTPYTELPVPPVAASAKTPTASEPALAGGAL